MSITERYRPKTEKDLIGNPKAIATLRESLKEGKNCLLYGMPGVGKTSSVYALAADLGFSVFEVNASDERRKEDLTSLLERVRIKGFRKHLYLLDEVDGMKKWETIEKILTYSRHIIVLVANDVWKIPKKVRDLCVEVRYYRPDVRDVVERVQKIAKQEGATVDFSAVGEDVRSSIIAAFYGGDKRKATDQFKRIDAVLRGRGQLGTPSKEDLIWLLDNLHNYYKGRDLFEAVNVLSIAARSNLLALEHLPKGGGKLQYPYYLRRKKVLRSGRSNKRDS